VPKSSKDNPEQIDKVPVPRARDASTWRTEMGEEMGMGMGGGRGGLSLKNLRTISSFKNPVYRLYYVAMLGQMAAMNMQIIARSFLVYRLTGSAAILALMSVFHAVPMLFFSIFGGVIADRVQKKYVLLAGQIGSAVVSLGIALALSQGYLGADKAGSWWILGVASVLQGTIMALMMPSRQAIMPEIVGDEHLTNAVALNTMGMNALRLAAPAAAGFLIDAFGFEAVYFTMTGLYVMATVFIVPMPLTSTMAIKGQGALGSVIAGFRYIRHETTILLILGILLVSVVLSMPYMPLMVIFADDILKVGASGAGILSSVSGAGAIIASIILASLPDRKRGAMLLLSGLIMGLALVGFAFSRSWYLSLGTIVFVGLGQTALMTMGMSLLLQYVEDEYRGRVMSIFIMQFGFTSFGTFLAGLLTESVGVQWAVGSFAMILTLLSTLALVFISRVRKLD